jgi:SAM-dependent methyltransferase
VGTGSGGIAHYFGTHPSGRYSVDAVDVVDGRKATEGYRFAVITGTRLPYCDSTFDIVVSNHVIEHVGNRSAQRDHLAELARVMTDDAEGYLAVPNRWMFIEPHYRLAFLSWLPRRWRTPYLRWRTGDAAAIYDCEPLALRELESLLHDAGLSFEDRAADAIRALRDTDSASGFAVRLVARLPYAVVPLFRRLVPTLVHTFVKRSAGNGLGNAE